MEIKSPILIDKHAKTAEKYMPEGGIVLPRFAIINGEGKIEYLKTGYEAGDVEKISQVVDKEAIAGYPPIGDQLDDLYKRGAFSDDMAAKLKKVKDSFPKPSWF